ncbi:MAG: hypothetical protein RIC55_01580 [Pirellulaceae bacterium]
MAKDRNTFAKRQREVEKKRKAAEKKERRAKRKLDTEETTEAVESPNGLSTAEHSVLNVFRTYLMTPGKMLCFGSADLDTYKTPLAQLADKGMLVAEKSRGGYSLTKEGFDAMRDSA